MPFRARTIEHNPEGLDVVHDFFTMYAARLHYRRRRDDGAEIELRNLELEAYEVS